MKYRGVPRGGAVDFYIVGLLAGGVAFWLLAGYGKAPTALFQLFAVTMIGAGLYLFIRYHLTVFEVALELRNPEVQTEFRVAMPCEIDLTVSRVKGKRTITQARLSLGDLKSAEKMTSDKVKESVNGASLYRYNTDMSPEGMLFIFCSEDDRDIALFTDLLPDKMMGQINRALNENKNKFTPEGDV